MTDTTCAACGSTQAAGAAWCAVCGTAFPRTGAPASSAPAAGGSPVPAGAVPAVPEPAVPVYTGTTEPERIAATVRGFSASAPAPAPAPAPVYAGTGRRFAAYLLDSIVIGLLPVVVTVVGVVGSGIPLDGTVATVTQAEADALLATLVRTYVLAGVLALAGWVALVVVEGRTGRTPAGLLLGLRTVDAQTLAPIGAGRSFLRWLVLSASGLVPAIGQLLMLLSPAFDASGRRQGWHDKAVRSVVLRQRGGQATAPADATFSVPTKAAAPQDASAVRSPSAAPWPSAPAPSAPAPSAPAPSAQTLSAPALSTPAPSAPASSPAVPDPWAFPSSAPAGPASSGLITGVPARPAEPSAPAPALAPTPAPTAPPTPPPAVAATPLAATPLAATPAAPAPTPPAPSDLAEIDGETRMTPARQQVLVLELATGERHPVTARTLLGRNPQAPAGEPWDVVAVPDPTRSVSKTHAELHPDLGGLWVVDRGSTNGTVVSVPGRAPQVAAPGSRVRVVAGATLHVGDARIVVRPELS